VCTSPLSKEKGKKEKKLKKSLAIATLAPNPQEKPQQLGRSLPARFVQARTALTGSVDGHRFTPAGDLALCNQRGQISPPGR